MTGVSVLLVPDVQRSGPPAVVEKAGQERQEVGRWKKESTKMLQNNYKILFFFSYIFSVHEFLY